jgi:hypothetical protein
MSRFLLTLITLVGFASSLAGTIARAQERPSLPPPETFFGDAPLQAVRLSPSGRWIAAQVATKGERAKLVVMDLENKVPAMVVAAFSRADVSWFRWVNDELLLLGANDHTDRSARYKYPALLSARRDGSSVRLLVKRELSSLYPQRGGSQPLEANHQFLSLGAPGSNEIIVGEVLFDAAYEVVGVRPIVLDAMTGVAPCLPRPRLSQSKDGSSIDSGVPGWQLRAEMGKRRSTGMSYKPVTGARWGASLRWACPIGQCMSTTRIV